MIHKIYQLMHLEDKKNSQNIYLIQKIFKKLKMHIY